jgi:Uma2 family endonuclease
MVASARSGFTYEDLLALGPDHRAELISGAIVERASPSFEHSTAQWALGAFLGSRVRGGDGGGVEWWFATEVEVAYAADHVYRHDLAGWRRDRHPVRPTGRPVESRPDWVCEILSPSNAKTDLVDKFRTLFRAGVPHYWLLDPLERLLTVYRHEPAGYTAVLTAAADETVAAEPFESAPVRVAALLGDEE